MLDLQLHGVECGVTYSTIKSLIDRLETKGALVRTATPGRVIYYRAAVNQDKVRNPLVESFLRRLYGDDLRPLFAQLLSDESLSDEEIAYLRGLLKNSGRKLGKLPWLRRPVLAPSRLVCLTTAYCSEPTCHN